MIRKRAASRSPKRSPSLGTNRYVYQFLVILANTNPIIWRRVQVPEEYTFWDLHVAIQDAMGWLDYHLHEFTVADSQHGNVVQLGIPDNEFPRERPCLPDWEASLSDYFRDGAPPALYVYDFGDDWQHTVIYEDLLNAVPSVQYPRCVDGARACPPEDCGGARRFADFLSALADPTHPEHIEFREWVGATFDPAAFEPDGVHFDDPRIRWQKAFAE